MPPLVKSSHSQREKGMEQPSRSPGTVVLFKILNPISRVEPSSLCQVLILLLGGAYSLNMTYIPFQGCTHNRGDSHLIQMVGLG
jgi:hypothetical protein